MEISKNGELISLFLWTIKTDEIEDLFTRLGKRWCKASETVDRFQSLRVHSENGSKNFKKRCLQKPPFSNKNENVYSWLVFASCGRTFPVRPM